MFNSAHSLQMGKKCMLLILLMLFFKKKKLAIKKTHMTLKKF